MKYPRALFAGAALAVSCTLVVASSLSAAPDEDDKKKKPAPAAEAKKEAEAAKPAAKAKPQAKPAAKPKAADEAKSDDKAKAKPSADAAKPGEKAKEGEAADAAPATHKVKAGPFELSVELDGTFESARATQIAIRPEAWSDLTVLETVSHGSVVKKGDVLVKLDTEKLEEQIRELELAQPVAELALQLAEEEFTALEASTPLNLNAARQAKMRAEEDLVYYEEVTKPQRIDSAHYSIRSAEFSLEYNQEELDQLRKMYAADDLTEETEEIIVKRAEYSVESAHRSLKSTRERSERSLTTTIPREHDDERRRIEQERINWRKAESTLPDGLKKARLDMAAQRRAFAKSAKKLEELKADLAAMTVTAPHDGVVYFGASLRGKWITLPTIEKKLRPSGKLMANEVIITLVQRAPLQLRTAVPEAKLPHLAEGQKATVTPTSNPDIELSAELATLSYVPLAGNTFDGVFAVAKGKTANIYPGMTAKLKIEVYKKAKALTVPKAAVKKEGGKHHVILADGKKREVKVGKSNDKVTEIIAGLKEGDEVKAK